MTFPSTRFLIGILGSFLANSAQAQVVISEVLASNDEIEADDYGAFSDWLELYNPSAVSINLEGWELRKGENQDTTWRMPSVRIGSKGYLRIWCSGKNIRTGERGLHANFKLAADGGVVSLFQPESEAPAFVFDYRGASQVQDVSYGLRHGFSEIPWLGPNNFARYLIPTDRDFGLEWTLPDYDDASWRQGSGPFGFDQKRHPTLGGEIKTNLGMLMGPGDRSVLFRFPFEVRAGDRGAIPGLNLRLKGGCVVYLNGHRVASFNAPEVIDANSAAVVDSDKLEDLNFSGGEDLDWNELLVEGTNLLAVRLLMVGEGPMDTFLSPRLTGTKIEPIDRDQYEYFDYPTPEEINGTGYTEIAGKPVIVQAGGVYAEPIRVEIRHAPGTHGVIHYTTDGMYPDKDSPRYEGPILVSSSTQLRARCFQSGKNPSLVANAHYSFLDADVRSFSSNLPIVVMDSLRSEIEAYEYTAIQFSVFDVGEDGRALLSRSPSLSERGAAKIRGSSTLSRPKKAYRIEIRDELEQDLDVPLLGMPEDSDWILYGPYNFDQSLIRNALVYELSRQMGHYAVRTRFVEAFVNSDDRPLSMTDYVGLYVLMEKVGSSKHRLNIKRPPALSGGAKDLSGGYLFKIDRLGVDEDGFMAGNQEFVHVFPNERDVTPDQSSWLSNHLETAFAALAGPAFKDPERGYAAYFDVDVWVDQHLIQELARNPDAYRYSTFLNKPRGEKLRLGPAWDFDRAMRTNTDKEWVGRAARPRGWIWGGAHNWFKLLMDDPAYEAKFRDRGRELLKGVWSKENVHRVIDSMAGEIAEAQMRNYFRWGYLNPLEWQNEIELLKGWMADRIDWLEAQFLPPPSIVSGTGSFVPPCDLVMTTSESGAKIYYTLDGRVPGLTGDRVAPSAQVYEGRIRVESDAVVTAAILTDKGWSPPKVVSCVASTPALVITEILYKPRRFNNEEFVELRNIGDVDVVLDGFSLSGAVDFDFDDSEVTTLGPGENLLIVRDIGAFKAAYATGGLLIAGEFSGDLSNTSGNLILSDEVGAEIADVYYTDAWYPETDGEGFSLELKQASVDPQSWRDPRNWRASEKRGGSPGH